MKEISRSSSRLELTTFVLGAPRSGTTLLRVMLAGHDKLFVPPEMVLAPFETMAQRKTHIEQRFWEKGGLRRALIELEKCSVDEAKQVELEMATKTVPEVYAYLQSLLGDRILADKCPHLSASLEALKRLQDWFRDTRFVWIVRHPGSVTRSLENMPYAELMLQRYAGDSLGNDKRPNILLVTADNLGYGDLKCYNDQSPIITPNLDRFARQSATLTSFYIIWQIGKWLYSTNLSRNSNSGKLGSNSSPPLLR